MLRFRQTPFTVRCTLTTHSEQSCKFESRHRAQLKLSGRSTPTAKCSPWEADLPILDAKGASRDQMMCQRAFASSLALPKFISVGARLDGIDRAKWDRFRLPRKPMSENFEFRFALES